MTKLQGIHMPDIFAIWARFRKGLHLTTFSLRALLVLIAVLAAGLAWIRYEVHHLQSEWHAEQEVRGRLEAAGVRIQRYTHPSRASRTCRMQGGESDSRST
jgi:hypothetical protein